jgi:hypothetical protein
METTISSVPSIQLKTTKTISTKKFWEMAEFNRFGVIAWILALVSCASGITAGFFVDGTSQLDITLVALPTMLTLCSMLIVAPMRWIIGIGAATFLIDLMIILF